METATRLYGYPIGYAVPRGEETGRVVIEFGESGWTVIEDTRHPRAIGGYLHIGQPEDGDISADEITDAVRDQIVKYFFRHAQDLPGVGATPQVQYMKGLSFSDREQIGNNGKRGFYA